MAMRYEAGRYWGRLKSQGMGKSKDKGTPFFAAVFDILGKVNLQDPDGDLLPCPQGECTIYMYLTEKTAGRVIEELGMLGYNKPSFRYLDPDAPGYVDLSGAEVALFVTPDEYNGNIKEKWGIHRDRGISGEPLDQAGFKQLDNLFGKQLKAIAQANPKRSEVPKSQAQQTVPPEPQGPPDDEIPF